MEFKEKIKILEKIKKIKNKLKTTDYKAIKYAEGLISFEEYLPIREERQALRRQINALEEEMKEGA